MREMKDSGIEWIGQIPKDWKVKNLKYFVSFQTGGTPRNKEGIDSYGDFSWFTPSDLENNNLVNSKFFISSDAVKNNGYNLFPPNSILLCCIASVGKVGFNLYASYSNQQITSLIPFTNTQSKFIFYFMIASKDKISFDASSNVVPIINTKYLSSFSICFPNFVVQQQIADFLDTKCSEIDATAEDIQKEISLLEDYKKSVITEAVTKGLNPDAEMKDSGVKWLPKIPKHWKVISSKYLFANSDIRRQTGDEQLTASQKYGIITQKDYTAKENAQIVLATQGLEKWKHVEPNDFIISLRSFQGGLEMSEITGCITWHYVVLKAQKEVYHKYYKWLFKSARYINALQGTCNFIRDGQDLRFSNFALVPLFELPLEEQQQIADFLDTKCSEIDTLIADKKRQLDILADYKKSLIYEYVTGKKEVPAKDF